MKFREHRGSLKESLKTTVTVYSRTELVAHLQQIFRELEITDGNIELKPLKFDERIGWNTYLVTLRDQNGVLGFTNGAL